MKKILHIDDDKFLLDLYGKVFKESGFEVVSLDVLDKDFVSQIDAIKPDLIISDVVRSTPNGLDLLKAIKADNRTKNIPFVFLSNSIDAEVKDASQKFGLPEPILKASLTPSQVVSLVLDIVQPQ
jgi:CheY-like chemotaxis protein